MTAEDARKTSALVRSAHHLHGVFDVPPGLGLLDFTLRFEGDGLPRGFDDRLRAVCFQKLSRTLVDFDFSHGVMLLSFCA
jgi:hypothetical protein